MLRYCKGRKLRLSATVSQSRVKRAPPCRAARPAPRHAPPATARTAHPRAARRSHTRASGEPTNKKPVPAPRRRAALPTGSFAERGGAGPWWDGAEPKGPSPPRSWQPTDNAIWLLGDLRAPSGPYSPCWSQTVLCPAAGAIPSKHKHNLVRRPFSTLTPGESTGKRQAGPFWDDRNDLYLLLGG